MDLDLTATGPLSREIRREEAATGGSYFVTKKSRSATATGAVAGIPMNGVSMDVSQTIIRIPANVDY